MIPILFVLLCPIIHWFADYFCQARWMANNKYKDIIPLLTHTSLYTLIWIIPITCFFSNDPKCIALFLIITFVLHTLTDFFTSKITHKAYEDHKERKFFLVLGIDQVLHSLQLYATFYLIQQYSYLL